MHRRILTVIAAGLLLGSLAAGQNAPGKTSQAPAVSPAQELADSLAQRLGHELQVKTIVGEPIKVGSVTLIPIMMIDVHFGGGGMTIPGGPAAAAASSPQAGVNGFFMGGEARPLGFVAMTKKGTRFISVVQTPAK